MHKGFTLVELLVSISIFAMVTVLVLAKYQSFNGGIILTNMAYEVALTIRQAQSSGIDVKGSGGTFDLSYGVHFDQDGNNRTFTVFSDYHSTCDSSTLTCTGDGRFDGGFLGQDQIIDTFLLGRGIVVEKVCTGDALGVGPETCSDPGSSVRVLDITYNRPDPSAVIHTYENNLGARPFLGGFARIRLKATSGAAKDIIVLGTGQISIQNAQ